MRILHLLATDDSGAADSDFAAMARMMGGVKEIGQYAILNHPRRHETLLSDLGISCEGAKFGGMFDLQTSGIIAAAAASFKPDIVQSHTARAAAFLPDLSEGAPAHIGLWRKGNRRGDWRTCDLVLAPGTGNPGRTGKPALYAVPAFDEANPDSVKACLAAYALALAAKRSAAE